MVNDRLSTALGSLVGLVGSFVVAGLLSDEPKLANNVNVALTLMVVVVVAAAIGGRAAGAIGAVAAACSYDFFQTQPVHSLRINSRNDVETAILLLVAGLIVGQIAARAQLLGDAVVSGQSEIRRLHRLADLAARGTPSSEVVDAAADELTQLLSLRSCQFEVPPYAGTYVRMERSGVLPRPSGLVTWTRVGRRGVEMPHEGAELPVLHRGAEVGRFVLVPKPGEGASLEERVVAVALADQVGAVLGDEPEARDGSGGTGPGPR